MSYNLKRECWNEKTYNGYTDNPYWRITFSQYTIGLTDNGKTWGIGDSYRIDIKNQPHIIEQLNLIIKECRLNIKLNLVVTK